MARVVMLAIGRLGFEEVKPVYVVRENGNIWALNAEDYLKKWRPNCYDVVEFHEVKADSTANQPSCVDYFLCACQGMNSYGRTADAERRDQFEELWAYCNTKQADKRRRL